MPQHPITAGRFAWAFVLAFGLGCGSTREAPPLLPDAPTAREARPVGGDARAGAALLTDATWGRTGLSCAACHALRADDAPPRPAPPLAGVAGRPGWWSGHARALPVAINLCVERYLAITARDGEVLGDLVAAVEALPGDPVVSRTFARAPPDPLAGGDPERGRALYARACAHCHDGGPGPALVGHPWPADVIAAAVRGLDRPRHPGTLMPAFPLEVLDDAALRDVIAWLLDAPPPPPPGPHDRNGGARGSRGS